MDPACAEEIRGRLAEAGLLLLEEPDYRRNLELRQQLYQQEGPIDCFVAVGGNVTSMGRGESGISLGQGLLSPEKIVRLTEGQRAGAALSQPGASGDQSSEHQAAGGGLRTAL